MQHTGDIDVVLEEKDLQWSDVPFAGSVANAPANGLSRLYRHNYRE
jgi:hypothetical protein